MLLLAENRFGRAVAARIERKRKVTLRGFREFLGGDLAEVGNHRFVAVALGRPYDKELIRLDVHCRRSGVPWSGVYMMDKFVYCGPLVDPNRGPCQRCFQRRELANLSESRQQERELVIRRALERDSELEIPGFVPPVVAMAAGMLVIHGDSSPEDAGQLRLLNAIDGGFVDTRVIPIHGCDCRDWGERPATGRRFVEHLVPKIRESLE